MQRHEFSHSFINPLTLKNWYEAKNYINLYNKTKEIKQNCYGDWEECLNEHIIRAVVIRLSSLADEGIEDKLVQKELSRGFIYIEDIIKSLKYYEQNRDIYKNIDEYYMKILKDLNKVMLNRRNKLSELSVKFFNLEEVKNEKLKFVVIQAKYND